MLIEVGVKPACGVASVAVFVHPAGICESTQVGEGTRIWAFAHVLPGARIGRDCNICDGVFIENDVIVGDAVTVKCGVQLWDGVRLGNRVFVGPNATFTNDPFPRSRQRPARFLQTVIEDEASIGANATILPGVRIGYGAMIGAGAVVVNDVPARAVVAGNPMRVVGYAGAVECGSSDPGGELAATGSGARLFRFQDCSDARGRLVVAEKANLPFLPKRFFLVDRVAPTGVRGGHCHRTGHQFMIAAAGEMKIALDDGRNAHVICLNDPRLGLYVPPMVWSVQFGHAPHAALLVMASGEYDPADYINDYAQFLALARDRSNH
jgi:acetyltransferase-like isoleucine patch superfamily enzyme